MKLTRSLLRGFEVLEALAEEGRPLGPARVAERVGLDKATVSRLLATLSHAGYVTRDPTAGNYRITARVLRLSRAFLEQCDLRGIARPHLTRLRDEVGETVHLGQADGDQIAYIDKLETARSVRLVSAIGQTMPVTTTALGKAMLSALDEPDRSMIISALGLPARTARSLTDPQDLIDDLDRTARRGYAIDQEENEDGVICVAVPVKDGDGRLVAAISISGPDFRVGPEVDRLGTACRDAAEAIARDLPAGVVAQVGFGRIAQNDASPTQLGTYGEENE
ncbi:IclR family transcriptional regulator [Actinobacteria bacterium YIM 96077]|uniref:Glycerol operon regulatory protein n=1 Tax=Phytoactinopolyspora halophila TaxID=1981511 RepID=A0A329QPD5_9ACTN|nr:IclR family transcriptional regulator [Phytoactinopolyspora halophila]AYY12599.1 IclR family transcriptional regulator [Actinobacteria bacterium YIM 96077]RAW12498.1 hypothetical protein DPM12_13945 [Phytoactinopolyspora halophila]